MRMRLLCHHPVPLQGLQNQAGSCLIIWWTWYFIDPRQRGWAEINYMVALIFQNLFNCFDIIYILVLLNSWLFNSIYLSIQLSCIYHLPIISFYYLLSNIFPYLNIHFIGFEILFFLPSIWSNWRNATSEIKYPFWQRLRRLSYLTYLY